MIYEEYAAKTSLHSAIEPLDDKSYISADCNLYRGNRKYPRSK